jgi:hypothetical protein
MREGSWSSFPFLELSGNTRCWMHGQKAIRTRTASGRTPRPVGRAEDERTGRKEGGRCPPWRSSLHTA